MELNFAGTVDRQEQGWAPLVYNDVETLQMQLE